MLTFTVNGHILLSVVLIVIAAAIMYIGSYYLNRIKMNPRRRAYERFMAHQAERDKIRTANKPKWHGRKSFEF